MLQGPFMHQENARMTKHPAGRHPRLGKTGAAAVGFGLGATLALSPLVWAQDAPQNAPGPNAGDASVSGGSSGSGSGGA